MSAQLSYSRNRVLIDHHFHDDGRALSREPYPNSKNYWSSWGDDRFMRIFEHTLPKFEQKYFGGEFSICNKYDDRFYVTDINHKYVMAGKIMLTYHMKYDSEDGDSLERVNKMAIEYRSPFHVENSHDEFCSSCYIPILHNVNGPARVYQYGDKVEYWLMGYNVTEQHFEKVTSLDELTLTLKPSDICDKERRVGAPHIQIWFTKEGQFHRLDGPAFICKHKGVETHVWYKRGVIHREGGPAVVRFKKGNSQNAFNEEYWLAYGHFHRLDGPAVDIVNSQGATKLYFVDGKPITNPIETFSLIGSVN